MLFLDTGYHFAETIGTRDAVEHVYGVEIVNATAEQTVARAGCDRSARICSPAIPASAAACARWCRCKRELSGYHAWVTGIRRVEVAHPRQRAR